MEPQKPVVINRQAVVLIHGIGEQRPMDTLREFVERIAPGIAKEKKPGEPSGRPAFYNKPDAMSDSYELRRLTANGRKDSYKTDYYEFYWAHLMDGTQLADVTWWIRNLFVRPPGRIPTRLRWVYYSFWIVLLTLLVVLGLIWWKGDSFTPDGIKSTLSQGWFKTLASLGAGLVWAMLTGVLKNYLGDAVRYFTPRPRNISERQKIRQSGVALLRRLHDAQIDGKNQYDRIVVVGHSLGSVIAYDLLRLYWIERNTKLPVTFGAIDRAETAASDLLTHSTGRTQTDSPTMDTYRKAQFDLWRSQYDKTNSWRISDLITAGSPLAFADLYLADTTDDFRRKELERELPTCPPTMEPPTEKQRQKLHNPDKKAWFSYPASDDGTARTLHHAAPFALTRWTNLYFKNDFVGGPINCFGPGVLNKEFVSESHGAFPFLSHVYYWDAGEPQSLAYLRKRMELRFSKEPVETPISKAVS